jgi:hypothetical protein
MHGHKALDYGDVHRQCSMDKALDYGDVHRQCSLHKALDYGDVHACLRPYVTTPTVA